MRVPRSVPDPALRRVDPSAGLREFKALVDASQIIGGDSNCSKAADEDRREAPARAGRPAADRSETGLTLMIHGNW